MIEIETNHLKQLGLYERSQKLVKILFRGKKDKAGKSYLYHLETVSRDFQEEKIKALALMHDLLEDTLITGDDLKQLGYEDDFIASLEVLTNRSNTYEEYIDTIIKNGNVNLLKIKMKDLLHNMDLTRIKEITPKDIKRTEKYMKAYDKIIHYLEGEEL